MQFVSAAAGVRLCTINANIHHRVPRAPRPGRSTTPTAAPPTRRTAGRRVPRGAGASVGESKLVMDGFRSLKEGEQVEFTYKKSSKGLESLRVTGPGGGPCAGSERRPKGKVLLQKRKPKGDRCYNCGGLDHHAKECGLPPQPKKCHYCQSIAHMVALCPHKAAAPAPGSQDEHASTSAPPAPPGGQEEEQQEQQEEQRARGEEAHRPGSSLRGGVSSTSTSSSSSHSYSPEGAPGVRPRPAASRRRKKS
ncbi:unnamed protein product [Boreogadus saida]